MGFPYNLIQVAHIESSKGSNRTSEFISLSSKVLYSSLVSGQAAQSVPSVSLKSSMAVYGQKLDGWPSR